MMGSYYVDPGELDKRVTILRFGKERDDAGGFLDDWPTSGWEQVCTRWARVEPLRGRTYFEAQQARANVTHRVTMRYVEGITPDMTINYAGRRLDIISVIDVNEGHDWMEIMTEEAKQ